MLSRAALSASRLRPAVRHAPGPAAAAPAVSRRGMSLNPLPNQAPNITNDMPGDEETRGKEGPKRSSAAFDSALGTLAGVGVVALGGIGYHYWYKQHVLAKMTRAFEPGFDPALALASASGSDQVGRVRRKEQDFVDQIVSGELSGQYLMLLGPKGTGKSSMVIDAAVKQNADGFAMLECHEDPEVVRLRLGIALDFQYNEDSFAGLFQRKDPREGGALLDIERALSKMEKVAIAFRAKHNRPLVLAINNIHHTPQNEAGFALLLQLQQRAESWAQAGVVTVIFNSDDYWVYKEMKRNASRMKVLSVRDLTPAETHQFLSASYAHRHPSAPPLSAAVSMQVWDRVGGRLAYLNNVVAHDDMLEAAEDMIENETNWLHSRLGLIPDHDDDVMDEQKVSSCSFSLFQALAELAEDIAPPPQEMAGEIATIEDKTDDKDENVRLALADEVHVLTEGLDPKLTYRKAREVMTRPDYLVDLDHQNIIHIDVHHAVRPDSRLMLSCFKRICSEEDFQDKLDNVKDRIDAIESLHRTSELTVKTGDADLGGFLRLRLGRLGPEHEKKEDDGEDDK